MALYKLLPCTRKSLLEYHSLYSLNHGCNSSSPDSGGGYLAALFGINCHWTMSRLLWLRWNAMLYVSRICRLLRVCDWTMPMLPWSLSNLVSVKRPTMKITRCMDNDASFVALLLLFLIQPLLVENIQFLIRESNLISTVKWLGCSLISVRWWCLLTWSNTWYKQKQDSY